MQEKKNQLATIENLPVDMKDKLGAVEKKELIKIVENEFNNKDTLYHEMKTHEREKVLEAYRKDVGFDKLIKEYEDAIAASERASTAMQDLGLNRDGTAVTYWGSSKKSKGWIKLERLLKACEQASPTHQIKAKVISRLWLSNTKGEAVVIMRQVMGNGMLPTVTADQL